MAYVATWISDKKKAGGYRLSNQLHLQSAKE